MATAADPHESTARLDLYWIPLGAGARIVRLSGRCYEAALAALQRRARRDLYHSALIATLDGVVTVIEMAPTPDDDGRSARGVVAEGVVGMRRLRRLRVFRYEVRRWCGGVIPDLGFAVGSPVLVTDDPDVVRGALDVLPTVPAPVWGRDELGAGEMWNSNSVVAWVLARAGVLEAAGAPPGNGRAPGWDAGVVTATRQGATTMPASRGSAKGTSSGSRP
jgi:hypothetical protein